MSLFRANWLLLVCAFSVGASPRALEFGGQDLRPRAQADACYLVFVELYRATYYANSAGDTSCVELEYRRSFSREELAQATSRIYKDLYGERQHAADAAALRGLAESYRSVDPGDRYRFCASASLGGELLRNDRPVSGFAEHDFASRVLGIWVADYDEAGRVEWTFPACAKQVF